MKQKLKLILASSTVKNDGLAVIGLGKKIKLTQADKIYAIIYDNIAKVTTKVDAFVNADGTVSVEVPSADCLISLLRYKAEQSYTVGTGLNEKSGREVRILSVLLRQLVV